MRFFRFCLRFFPCLILALTITFFGCAKVNPLYNRVSELRSHLFIGNSEHFSIAACYGFKETPFNNDAVLGEKVYSLHFKIDNEFNQNATYSLSFNLYEKEYSLDFKFNPVTHNLSAAVELENFNEKQFSVTVSSGGISELITLTSIVPDGTIDYKTALDYLYQNQRPLVDSFIDENGDFNAEIYTRVIVKDDKPYWYVGIASGGGNLKALLIDGFSGEVLAIREIF